MTNLIKTRVTRAAVASFDQTTLRCGPVGRNKYVLSASTELCTLFHLAGSWHVQRVRGAARFAGVAAHDR